MSTETPERTADLIRADERARCVAELRDYSAKRMEAAVYRVASGKDDGLGGVSFAATLGKAASLLESGEIPALLADQGEAETR